MSNITSLNNWFTFLCGLYDKINNEKIKKLDILNEINNLLLIFFICKNNDIDDNYNFFIIYEKFCNSLLIDNQPHSRQHGHLSSDKLYKKIYDYYCNPDNNNCVLNILFNVKLIEKYGINDIPNICNLSKNIKCGKTIQNIFRYIYEYFNNITIQSKSIKELSLNDLDFYIFGDEYHIFIEKIYNDQKKKLKQYFIPIILKEYIINKIDIKDSESFYDPCAGLGSFINVVIKYIKDNKGNYNNFIKNLYANECNDNMYKILSMNMLIHDIPIKNFNKLNSLNLTYCNKILNNFDVIVTNPIYYTDNNNYYKPLLKKNNDMGKYIMHIYHSLKVGGRCGIISDIEILSTDLDNIKLRKFILKNTNLYKIIITISTCILFFIKGSKTNNVEFRKLKFKECNKIIEYDILLRIVNIKDIIKNNYSLKYNDYIKQNHLHLSQRHGLTDCKEYIKLELICNTNPDFKYCTSKDLKNANMEYNKDKYKFYNISKNLLYLDTYKINKESIIFNKYNIYYDFKFTTSDKVIYVSLNDAFINIMNLKYIFYYIKIFNQNVSLSKQEINNLLILNLKLEHQNEIIKLFDEYFIKYDINEYIKYLGHFDIFQVLINKKYNIFDDLQEYINTIKEAEKLINNQINWDFKIKINYLKIINYGYNIFNIYKNKESIKELNLIFLKLINTLIDLYNIKYNKNLMIKSIFNKYEQQQSQIKKITEICNFYNYDIDHTTNFKFKINTLSQNNLLYLNTFDTKNDIIIISINETKNIIDKYLNNSINLNGLVCKLKIDFYEFINFKYIFYYFKFIFLLNNKSKYINQDQILIPYISLEKQYKFMNKIDKIINHKSYSNQLKIEIENIIKIINNMTILNNNIKSSTLDIESYKTLYEPYEESDDSEESDVSEKSDNSEESEDSQFSNESEYLEESD
jgi:type I restriction-modification system DNA methylase subunit